MKQNFFHCKWELKRDLLLKDSTLKLMWCIQSPAWNFSNEFCHELSPIRLHVKTVSHSSFMWRWLYYIVILFLVVGSYYCILVHLSLIIVSFFSSSKITDNLKSWRLLINPIWSIVQAMVAWVDIFERIIGTINSYESFTSPSVEQIRLYFVLQSHVITS